MIDYKKDERFLWKIGSLCSVYSRSNRQWYNAIILDIFIDANTKKEWLIVRYDNSKRKTIQRLCKDIKPLYTDDCASTVYMIGRNQNYECGQTLRSDHEDGDYCTTLTLCKWSKHRKKRIVEIQRGFGFNICTFGTRYDELIVFGFFKNVCKFTKLILPNHLILVCLDYFGNNYNEYWSVGDNGFGQCALGHSDNVRKLTQIKFNYRYQHNDIYKIAIGPSSRNVVWIRHDGGIYINGRNLQKHSQTEITIPMDMRYFLDKSLKCVDAASSYFHSMIVCNDGSVWSSGRGNFGELGHGGSSKLFCELFVRVKALQKHIIVNVSAGNYFSIFLCNDGNIWSCGKNVFGQCGLGYSDEDRNRVPTKIGYFEWNKIKIVRIECALHHTLALDENGRLYCWGKNNLGQCALDTSIHGDSICIPSLVQYFCDENKKIIDIKTGGNHSGCVTEDKLWHIWGCNDYNECCTDHHQDVIYRPHCINSYVEECTNGKQIVDVTLGSCNTMMIVH